MKKFKNWINSKAIKVGAALSVAAASLCAVASAAEGDPTGGTTASVISSLETGFQGFASDAMTMIGKIVVIALPVAGVIWLARKAVGWFKSMGK